MSKSTLYLGSFEDGDMPVFLKAGPVSLVYQNGYIRTVCCNNKEIVKRVYVAIRDQHWNTIAAKLSDVIIEKNENSFEISFKSEHIANEIDFSWNGKITGTSNGVLSFTMSGSAGSSFKKNRIGFCVLHPNDLCAGQKYKVIHIDGSNEEGTFPLFINPFHPVKSIRSIEYTIENESSVCLTFEGDIFEMEDQRNWTDASFKTYCTPSSNPSPVLIEKGTKVEQKVTIEVKNSSEGPCILSKNVELHVPEGLTFPKVSPDIGVDFTTDIALTPLTEQRLELLSLSHIRFDLFLSSSSILRDADQIAGICNQLGVMAEVALYLTEDLENDILLVKQLLFSSQIPTRRFLIFRENEQVTSAETIKKVVFALKSYSSSALISAGTDGYFVDINRNHPAADLLDQVCYSANPQVHTFDSYSVMENVSGIYETLRSSYLFLGRALPIISPVTLRPRRNRKNPLKAGGTDPRQKGLFCAAWTVAHLMHCIEGGAASLTYFESMGDGGIISDDGSVVYPVYHILAIASEMAGAAAQKCTFSSQSEVASIVFIRGTKLVALIANLTDDKIQVHVSGLPVLFFLKCLDENTVYEACHFPEEWKCNKGVNVNLQSQTYQLTLLPFAVVQIEASLLA